MTAQLSDKRRRFVEEYLVDANATQAAIRAGYSSKTAYAKGHQLLKDSEVAEAIRAGQEILAKKAGITAADVIEGLLAEARRFDEGSSHAARVSAWTQLGRHLGLFQDRLKVEGLEESLAALSDEAIERELEIRLARLADDRRLISGNDAFSYRSSLGES